MLRLAVLFYVIVAPTLAGIFSLVPLTIANGQDFEPSFFIAFVAAGAVLAVPVSWFVAKKIDELISKKGPAAPA